MSKARDDKDLDQGEKCTDCKCILEEEPELTKELDVEGEGK